MRARGKRIERGARFRAVSVHQDYYFWGPPDFDDDTMIVLQSD